MGIVLSRFRTKKTTIEILEDLDTKIKEIQEYGQTTEQRHKKIVGTLVIYSVALYITTAFIFYFYFFPASLYDQIFYITPLLIFPILILFTKKMVSWYYKRKISQNQEKLITLQQQKSMILDEVTETETYKKAKEILSRFAPDQLKMTPSPLKPSAPVEKVQQSNTPRITLSTPRTGEIRRRILPTSNLPGNVPSGTPVNPQVIPVGISPVKSLQLNTASSSGLSNSPAYVGFRTPLPRPILPRQRSYFDRLVDYLVSDGPSNRYALICRQCKSHNGMALKEEFEYFGFRCCYCNFWNPPKKQKPGAPKLEFNMEASTALEAPVHGSPDKVEATSKETEGEPSDTDSDIEVVERPNEVSEIQENITEKSSNVSQEDSPEGNRSGVQSIVQLLKEEDHDTKMMEVDS